MPQTSWPRALTASSVCWLRAGRLWRTARMRARSRGSEASSQHDYPCPLLVAALRSCAAAAARVNPDTARPGGLTGREARRGSSRAPPRPGHRCRGSSQAGMPGVNAVAGAKSGAHDGFALVNGRRRPLRAPCVAPLCSTVTGKPDSMRHGQGRCRPLVGAGSGRDVRHRARAAPFPQSRPRRRPFFPSRPRGARPAAAQPRGLAARRGAGAGPRRRRQRLPRRRAHDPHADDRHRPAGAGQPDRVRQRGLPAAHRLYRGRGARPQLPLPARRADRPRIGARGPRRHRRPPARAGRAPELSPRRHGLLERALRRPDLRYRGPAAVLLRLAARRHAPPRFGGRLSPGAEDGGDRPAHRGLAHDFNNRCRCPGQPASASRTGSRPTTRRAAPWNAPSARRARRRG